MSKLQLVVNPEFNDLCEELGVDNGACQIVALATEVNGISPTDALDYLMTTESEELIKQFQLAIKGLCRLEDGNEYVLKVPFLIDANAVSSHYNQFKNEFIRRGWNYAGSPNAQGGIQKFKFDEETERVVNQVFDRIVNLYNEINDDIVFEILGEYYHTPENQQLLRFTNFLTSNFEVEYATRIRS